MTLLELLLALGVFTVVGLALGSLYASSRRAMDVGSAQVFVQQQGTLIQEELSRQLLSARQAAAGTAGSRACGPSGLDPQGQRSLRFERAIDGSAWCIYQFAYSGEPELLHICGLASFAVVDCGSPARRPILFGAASANQFRGTHPTAGTLGAQMAAGAAAVQLRVLNTSFATGLSVDLINAWINFQFQITDCTLFESAGGCSNGLPFSSSVTLRNYS